MALQKLRASVSFLDQDVTNWLTLMDSGGWAPEVGSRQTAQAAYTTEQDDPTIRAPLGGLQADLGDTELHYPFLVPSIFLIGAGILVSGRRELDNRERGRRACAPSPAWRMGLPDQRTTGLGRRGERRTRRRRRRLDVGSGRFGSTGLDGA
jgi:hypothetical protein